MLSVLGCKEWMRWRSRSTRSTVVSEGQLAKVCGWFMWNVVVAVSNRLIDSDDAEMRATMELEGTGKKGRRR